MISIVSVPHTGTKFVEMVLTEMGYETRHAHFHADHPLQNPWVWLEEGAKIVIPWRDPELARISALNRGEEPRPVSDFMALLSWTERPNVHLFEVECANDADRIEELVGLREFLDAPEVPDIDWTPLNASEDVTGLKAAYQEER